MRKKQTFDLTTQRPKPRGGRRDGAGRPKIMQDSIRILVGLDRADHKRMQAAAGATGQTIQETYRTAIRSWLNVRESLLPTKRGKSGTRQRT